MASQSLTPEQMEHTPAGPPPPGVTPNFVDPPTENAIFFGICTPLQVIMMAFVCVRIYAKVRRQGSVWRNLAIDDYLVVWGAFLTTLFYILACYLVTAAKYGTDMWNVRLSLTESKVFLVSSYIGPWFTSFSLLWVKLTFFVMYLHLFRPYKWVRIVSYIGAALVSAFYLGITITQLYATTPSAGQTWAGSFENPRYLISTETAVPLAAVGLGFDVSIIIIPLIAVWQLQMTTGKKIGVGVVFMFGIFAIIASAVGLYYRTSIFEHLDNVTVASFPIYVCLAVELQAGVISACMPVFAGVMRNPPEFAMTFRSKVTSAMDSLLSRSSHSRSRTSQKSDNGRGDPGESPDGRDSNTSDGSTMHRGHDKDIELGEVTPTTQTDSYQIQVTREMQTYPQQKSDMGSRERNLTGVSSYGE